MQLRTESARGHNYTRKMKKRKSIKEEKIQMTPVWEKVLFILMIAATVAMSVFVLKFDFFQTYQ